MCVKIGDSISENKDVFSVVLQGSVLGPLLFGIGLFVNDILHMLNYLQMI